MGRQSQLAHVVNCAGLLETADMTILHSLIHSQSSSRFDLTCQESGLLLEEIGT